MIPPPELRFKNSKDRVRRAYIQLTALNSEWHAIFNKEATSTKIRKDKYPGWHIASTQPSPECVDRIKSNQLSLILGEIAYQLRAALDGLIWDAITYAQGAEPSANDSGINRLEFPILNGQVRNFDNCAFNKFPFPPKLKDWMRGIQPDTADKPVGDLDLGLQNTLEDIHNLSRFDRHRRLRVVSVVSAKTQIAVETVPSGGGIVAHEWIDWDLFGGQYDFLRLKVRLPGDLIPHDIRLKSRMTFEISAEDVPNYDGDDAGVQIDRFIQAVCRVIARFEEEFI